MEFYSSGKAAKLLGIKQYTLMYRVGTGAIQEPEHKVGGKRVWTDAEVDKAREALKAVKSYKKSKSAVAYNTDWKALQKHRNVLARIAAQITTAKTPAPKEFYCSKQEVRDIISFIDSIQQEAVLSGRATKKEVFVSLEE
jgi:hypothetical protein